MSLKFRIIEKCYQNAKGKPSNGADFLLEKDGWNDYGYLVMYHLHATYNLTGKGNEYLGAIRIMKKGQQEYKQNVLEEDLGGYDFVDLPEDYVSLSASIDLYDSLANMLSVKDRESFVKQLHLIFDEDSKFYDASLRDDECFNKALLRDITFDNFALGRGKALMLNIAFVYNLREQAIRVGFANCDETLTLNFSCLSDCDSEQIPNGVIAFIGKNGSGKSTAIYNLAKIIYANPDQRFRLKDAVGILTPNNLGISRLFIVSYSPFDNFVLPGIGGEDYQLLLNGIENGTGRFVFCGIRDIQREFDDILKNPDPDTYEKLFEKHRQTKTCLKPLESLANEFDTSMNMLMKDESRLALWNEVKDKAKVLFPEISLVMSELFETDNKILSFQRQSTGYKFFLHSLSRIIAYIDNNSIILFDEPENHIHPPMLSFMMSILRLVLSRYKLVMLVATHSPVVLQETFAKNVFVVRGNGSSCNISHPLIETYGASISEIVSEVFDLTTDVTNYYNAYEALYDKWNEQENWESIDDMLNSFSCHLGESISSQLVSYLINLYVSRHPEMLN